MPMKKSFPNLPSTVLTGCVDLCAVVIDPRISRIHDLEGVKSMAIPDIVTTIVSTPSRIG
jgi:hypothetical protein